MPIDRIQFSFRKLEDAQGKDEASQPFNGDEQEAQMMALYEEKEKKEIEKLAKIDPELAKSISDIMLGDETPAR
ncbi:hypothetical protein CFIMG_007542RA00001 [Ceratocystis fimbriata CBS 114723]|uniref:Uncharacterized protein n=1 Tax=Ceratocystis fimbriata CBS 114723 TaxID=1035309 RepID=A0A2C5WW29_9PEZI|nr:hypothetical protein CFIMG_007542RA00001 [Ceratocystis fimbriata CBS 114723]